MPYGFEDIKVFWPIDEQDCFRFNRPRTKTIANKETTDDGLKVAYMWDGSTGSIDSWHKYCQKQMRDNYHPLDEELIFSNTKLTRSSMLVRDCHTH